MFYNNPYLINQQGSYPAAQYLSNMNQQAYQNQQYQQNNGITWVQGKEGAKAVMLPPNSNIVLMDSYEDKFYIKTTDASGMPSMREFMFTEVTGQGVQSQQAAPVDTSSFVTRDEFDKLRGEIGTYINSLFTNIKESKT